MTHITFSNDFNLSIKNYIPQSVTHLVFGFSFDKPINGYIPSSVTHLTFGAMFDRPIDECIPQSVVRLEFGEKFNFLTKNCIPPSVKQLKFKNPRICVDNILETVDHLYLSHTTIIAMPIRRPALVEKCCFGFNYMGTSHDCNVWD